MWKGWKNVVWQTTRTKEERETAVEVVGRGGLERDRSDEMED
jgi:hypothetical protein